MSEEEVKPEPLEEEEKLEDDDEDSGEDIVDLPDPDYENLQTYFPFKEMRTGQPEVLAKIQSFLLDPDKKFLCLELPTGTGKSPIAIAAARSSKSAYIITSNKMLQQQYLRDFDEYLADLRGRSNYECRLFKRKDGSTANCANSPCRDSESKKKECSKKAACEYHDYLKKAKVAPITSFNTAAYLPFLSFSNHFERRNLLIVDEAHQTVNQLTSFIELKLQARELLNLGLAKELPDYNGIDFYDKFLEQIADGLKELKRDSSGVKPEFKESIELLDNKLRMFRRLKEKQGLKQFVLLKEKDVGGKLKSIGFKPVVVEDFAHKHMFRFADKVIFLSATILDFKTFSSMLGIKPETFDCMATTSTFPVANRPIITSMAIGPLNMYTLEKELPNLVDRIRTILSHYKEYKGIIHGVSYKICNYIHENLNDPRILFPKTAFEQKAILETHNNSTDTVLLSPSMTEGLDLKDEESRFQILVKLPYPSLGDPIVKARKEIYPDFYNTQTALTMVQSYGRSVRSETDWCHTYILDSGVFSFLSRTAHVIPRWFTEAVRT